MNREILFRGFHPDENGSKTITLNGEKIKGEWVEGDLIQTHLEYPDGKKEIDCEIRTRTIGVDLDSFYGGYMAGSEENVIPETVGQYTGLTDKNGNKIFEGDTVKITDEIVNGTYYARVQFGNPNAQFNWGFQLVPMCKTPFAVEILHWCDMEESGAFIEVIGNIYEEVEK